MTLTRNLSMGVVGDKRGANSTNEILIYASVAFGVLAGAAISTYMWRSRVHAALDASPDKRADKIIEACEKKLERIERLMSEFNESK